MERQVTIPPGVTVKLGILFGQYRNNHYPYMYHCHMLFHEDKGMMGQYMMVEPGGEPDLQTDYTAMVGTAGTRMIRAALRVRNRARKMNHNMSNDGFSGAAAAGDGACGDVCGGAAELGGVAWSREADAASGAGAVNGVALVTGVSRRGGIGFAIAAAWRRPALTWLFNIGCRTMRTSRGGVTT